MLVLSPRDLNEANVLKCYASFYLIGVNDLTPSHFNNFSCEDIFKLKKINKIILRLDFMYYDTMYDKIMALIKDFKDEVLYYVSDLGLVNILKENKLIANTIYDPKTMITNSLDAKFYYDLGLCGIGFSLEVPFKDILVSKDYNLFIEIFGKRLMYNSRRKALKAYLKHYNLKANITNNIKIKEITRNDYFSFYENECGDFIYRSYFLNLLKEFKEANFKFEFIESLEINSNDYLEIVKNFYEYKNNLISFEEANSNLNKLNLKYEEGFLYKDTIYEKEQM